MMGGSYRLPWKSTLPFFRCISQIKSIATCRGVSLASVFRIGTGQGYSLDLHFHGALLILALWCQKVSEVILFAWNSSVAPSQLQEPLDRRLSTGASARVPCLADVSPRVPSCACPLSLPLLLANGDSFCFEMIPSLYKMMILWCNHVPICLSHSPDCKSLQAMG